MRLKGVPNVAQYAGWPVCLIIFSDSLVWVVKTGSDCGTIHFYGRCGHDIRWKQMGRIKCSRIIQGVGIRGVPHTRGHVVCSALLP
jgi:hypothetical protein